jgi:hypothetical protein
MHIWCIASDFVPSPQSLIESSQELSQLYKISTNRFGRLNWRIWLRRTYCSVLFPAVVEKSTSTCNSIASKARRTCHTQNSIQTFQQFSDGSLKGNKMADKLARSDYFVVAFGSADITKMPYFYVIGNHTKWLSHPTASPPAPAA